MANMLETLRQCVRRLDREEREERRKRLVGDAPQGGLKPTVVDGKSINRPKDPYTDPADFE